MDRAEIIRLLAVNADHVFDNTLVGNPAPRIAELLAELCAPKVGDLVVETSTLGMKGRTPAIGRLTKVAREPAHAAEAWDEAQDGPMPFDTFWYIVNLDGEEERWSNCSFIKVLEARWPNLAPTAGDPGAEVLGG